MRRILGMGSVFGVIASMGVVLGATMSPASADGTCDYGGICVWQHNDRGGTEFDTVQSYSNWDYPGNPGALQFLNDKGSSSENIWTTTYAKIWEHDSQSGTSICVRPSTYISNFPSSMDNKSSSNKFYSSC